VSTNDNRGADEMCQLLLAGRIDRLNVPFPHVQYATPEELEAACGRILRGEEESP
jgi:hypothetical protein